MTALLAVGVALAALALGLVVWRRTSQLGRSSRRLSLYAACAGALAAALCIIIEGAVLRATGLDFDVQVAGAGGALLAAFLLAAPLEEAAKVLVVWPLYRTRRIDGSRLGMCYASTAAAGFAAIEGAFLVVQGEGSWLAFARGLLGVPAHLFFAGAWGYALGAERRSGRWFSITWVVAVLLHGLYDHILWGRGPGYLAAALPMLGFMSIAAISALREVNARASTQASLLDPPSLSEMRQALRPAEKPVMLRWVVLGTFVTFGLVITLSVASVFVGRRMGIDFTLADEADVRSAGPLALLGTFVLLSFPVSGYLIARASGSPTVLEPALSTLLSLVVIVGLLALSAPIAVLFALAVAPIAIGLACAGAWIGLER